MISYAFLGVPKDAGRFYGWVWGLHVVHGLIFRSANPALLAKKLGVRH